MDFYFIQYNKLFLINTLMLIFFNFSSLCSQDFDNSIILNEVQLSDKIQYSSKEYFYYKRKVKKVFHYLDTINNIIFNIDSQLLTKSKKKYKKNFIRNYKKKLMDKFLIEIKSLTRKEGVILSKLVYREFGISVFDIIEKYKGKWSAFWWQNLALLYDGDIKSKYDPKKNKEDFIIEKIINNEMN